MSSLGQLDRKSVVINSTFRAMGTPSSFMWKFSERVEGIRYADLRMFAVENGLYNVDSTNNTFYLSENWAIDDSGWEFEFIPVVIPTGYYDDVTFASTLGLAMSNVSTNKGGNLYLCQILNSGLLQITLASASTVSNGTFAIGFTDGVTVWQPTAELLGFTTLTINAYSSLTSGLYQTIISQTPTALVVYDYLLINSQKLGNDVSFYSGRYTSSTQIGTDTPLKPNPSSCWAVVPNNQPSRDNNVLIWENVRPPQIATLKYPYSLDYIDINILDKFGVPVDLTNQSVTLVVELYTDKKGQEVSTTHHSY